MGHGSLSSERQQEAPGITMMGSGLRGAAKGVNGFAVQKQNRCWLLVTHQPCIKDDLHSAAIDSSFRNSGITVGKKGKTAMAVRSTHNLEVPLSHKGKLMVTEEYIDFLLNIANQKMEENKKRIERFYNCLQHALERETITNLHPKIKEKHNSSYTHKKKRNPEKTRGKCITDKNNEDTEQMMMILESVLISSLKNIEICF
ncbi:tRNA wybutosine-synthesizing protein 3 homolog [Dugong dugon]